MSRLRVYEPRIGPEHPEWIVYVVKGQCLATSLDKSGRKWWCTAKAGHGSHHGAHEAPDQLAARWPQEPAAPEPCQTPDFCEALQNACAEADAMMALASIDATKSLAITALDQAQTTADPQWFVAAEHYVRALHALALVGTGAEVEDEDGGEG